MKWDRKFDGSQNSLNDIQQNSMSSNIFQQELGIFHRLYSDGDGGGVLPEVWVGVCGALLDTLTLLQTKICDFP